MVMEIICEKCQCYRCKHYELHDACLYCDGDPTEDCLRYEFTDLPLRCSEDPLHEFDDWPLVFKLTVYGKLLVTNRKTDIETECPWFTDAKTGKPWLVKKRKTFKSLIKQADREGDYDDLKGNKTPGDKENAE